MTKITDTKQVYEVFKYFKSIYTKIKVGENLILIGNSEEKRTDIIFKRDFNFSLFYGRIENDNIFFNWLKENNKVVEMSAENINLLGKVLKKNVVSVEYDDTYFSFNFIDKETENSTSIILYTKKITEKIEVFNFTYSFKLDNSFLKEEIVNIFFKEGNITNERNKEKIIEIPKNKISSLLNEDNIVLSFSEKNDVFRYVSIKSKDENLQLELEEIFKTI